VTDTIVALSSGRPPAAISIVRISGPAAIAIAGPLIGDVPPARTAALRAVRDQAGALLDRALVLVFPGPRSATGEDLIEIHCHGGTAVVAAIEGALVSAGCRRAEAGEFTRRALTNGRVDLAEAEGLADLLEAETEAQRVAALSAAEGRVSRLVGGWMQGVAAISARIEALIDYDDEDDVDTGETALASIVDDARRLATEIRAAIDAPPVERLRDGIRVVIAGPPNAGKSTLLNLLSERDAAIVTSIAGTTRDVVEVPVRRGDHAYVLTDTAGLTTTDDVVEMIGVGRAAAAIDRADVLLWLGDGEPPRGDAIWLFSRADLPERQQTPVGALPISRERPGSIDALWAAIANRSAILRPRADAVPWRRRHQEECREAADALTVIDKDPILLAESYRLARQCLGRVIGVDATEAMLDALFSRFCIGK
jgi:tRNA modification GTPase